MSEDEGEQDSRILRKKKQPASKQATAETNRREKTGTMLREKWWTATGKGNTEGKPEKHGNAFQKQERG